MYLPHSQRRRGKECPTPFAKRLGDVIDLHQKVEAAAALRRLMSKERSQDLARLCTELV
jgi:hypothetical protein